MHGNPLLMEALTAVPNPLSVLPLGVFDNMEPVDIFGKFTGANGSRLVFPDGLIPFVKTSLSFPDISSSNRVTYYLRHQKEDRQ